MLNRKDQYMVTWVYLWKETEREVGKFVRARGIESARNFKVAVPVFSRPRRGKQRNKLAREKETEYLSLWPTGQPERERDLSKASWKILRTVCFSHLWIISPSTCTFNKKRDKTRGRVRGRSYVSITTLEITQHLKKLLLREEGRRREDRKVALLCAFRCSLVCCWLQEAPLSSRRWQQKQRCNKWSAAWKRERGF